MNIQSLTMRWNRVNLGQKEQLLYLMERPIFCASLPTLPGTTSSAIEGMMMKLPTLSVEGFKTFRDKTVCQLSPLTLFYGRNQAGKSTILRLLPFLGDSLQNNVPLLELQSPALMGSTLKELGWLGPEPSKPKLKIEIDGHFYHVQVEGDSKPYVNRLELGYRSRKRHRLNVSLAGDAVFLSNQVKAPYDGTFNNSVDDEPWSGELAFHSFLVSEGNIPDESQKSLGVIRQALEPFQRLQWFHANRIPDGEHRGTSRRSLCCSPTGDDLATLLDSRKGIIDRASAWFSKGDVLGEKLSVQRDARGNPHFLLRRSGHEARPVHLAGEGMRSVLPIILCASWAEEKAEDSPTMLVIEEPESHLHPTLQLQLIERLLETVRAGIPVVLETHSVYILRAIQLAILEERIRTDELSLYWVQQDPSGAASLDPIEIAGDATLGNWQPGTFEEEQQLAHQIMHKRWEKINGERI